MRKNSIAYLTDEYASPLLMNTLAAEEVPVYAASDRLRNDLGRYRPDLMLLDEAEASRMISKRRSLLYTNSSKGLATVSEIFSNPREIAYSDLAKGLVETKGKRCEEFVCDAYLDSEGLPVVLGIYAHPVQDEKDIRDIVYYTSRKVMRDMLPQIEASLGALSGQKGLQNLPFHAKFDLFEKDLIMREVRPGSFGSFSICDLLFFAFRLNPYKLYFTGRRPDWESLLSSAGDDIFFRVLGRLPDGVLKSRKPDHELFADTFDELLGYCKLDIERYPAFSIGFGRTGDLEQARKYLRMDFGDYFT